MSDHSAALRAIFDNLDLVTWAVDMHGTIIVSEGGALRALGIPPGALVGTNFFTVFGKGDGAANMQRAMASEPLTAVHVENGRTLESRFIPVRDQAGAVIHVIGVTLDITDRLASEAALDRQSVAVREQAELLDLAHDAIIVRTLTGIITYWNHGAHILYGHTRDDAVGREVHALLHSSADLREIQPQLLRAGYWDGELTHTRSDGQQVIVSSRWVLKRDPAGQPESVLQIDTDITARRQAEAAEAQRQDEIIAAQARAIEELSTPLIPITDDILVMPLVGMMDSVRAKQVMTNLLDGLATSRGKFAILDITGVPVVDTAVANAILRAAHAARLLGTEVILTGIRPEVAQTLVHLDTDLKNIITRGTLQSGIAYATKRRNQKSS